jgi:4-amino-4-deoxychorismate lyase
MSEAVCYRGTRRVAAPGPVDRGLAYGDGLFETVRVYCGRPVLWREHLARLRRGLRRLRIAADLDFAAVRALEQAAGIGDGVLKLVLTRGSGGRGYAPFDAVEPLLLLSRHPAPLPAPTSGLVLRWCDTRLAIQPALAGIKHLNRLEQVLARAEWRDQRIHEGLCLDREGHVVCATAANVFLLREGRWLTPRLDRCGVEGCLRAWLLRRVAGIELVDVRPQDIEAAEAVFLASSVRGILPVRRIGPRRFDPHPALAELRARVARAFPAFAQGNVAE